MQQPPHLPPRLHSELETFLDNVPPLRLSSNLRRLLLTHLTHQQDAYGLTTHHLYTDLTYLFELLEVMAEAGRAS